MLTKVSDVMSIWYKRLEHWLEQELAQWAAMLLHGPDMKKANIAHVT